jgi:hypothetical protein
VQLRLGAQATVRRLAVVRNQLAGAQVLDAQTAMTAVDLYVATTRSRSTDGMYGIGLVVQHGASVHLERGALNDNTTAGVGCVGNDTRLVATDLTVVGAGTDEQPIGHGIEVAAGGQLDGLRVALARNGGVGALVLEFGSRLTLEEVTVREHLGITLDGRQVEGAGLVSSQGGDLRASRFLVSESALAGLQVASQATVLAVDGLVTSNAIGLNLQAPELDTAEVFQRVRSMGNEVDVDRSALDVPSASALPPGATH